MPPTCPGCGRSLGRNWSEDRHGPLCPAIYEAGSVAFHELTKMLVDRFRHATTPLG